jgi:hypothetical protein
LNEGYPSHSRDLIKKMCIKISSKRGNFLYYPSLKLMAMPIREFGGVKCTFDTASYGSMDYPYKLFLEGFNIG